VTHIGFENSWKELQVKNEDRCKASTVDRQPIHATSISFLNLFNNMFILLEFLEVLVQASIWREDMSTSLLVQTTGSPS
jgi:hypothetical protein